MANKKFAVPKGNIFQWFALIIAIVLVSYVPVMRIYLYVIDKTWGNLPQDSNTTKNTAVVEERKD
jgi:hypothetical protein